MLRFLLLAVSAASLAQCHDPTPSSASAKPAPVALRPPTEQAARVLTGPEVAQVSASLGERHAKRVAEIAAVYDAEALKTIRVRVEIDRQVLTKAEPLVPPELKRYGDQIGKLLVGTPVPEVAGPAEGTLELVPAFTDEQARVPAGGWTCERPSGTTYGVSPDGTVFALYSCSKTRAQVLLLNLRDGSEIKRLRAPILGALTALAVTNRAEHRVLLLGAKGRMVLDTETGASVAVEGGYAAGYEFISLAANGRGAFVCHRPKEMPSAETGSWIDLTSGSVRQLPADLVGHCDLDVAPGGRLIASWSSGLAVWDHATGKAVFTPTLGAEEFVRQAAFNADGTLLTALIGVGREKATLRQWRTNGWAPGSSRSVPPEIFNSQSISAMSRDGALGLFAPAKHSWAGHHSIVDLRSGAVVLEEKISVRRFDGFLYGSEVLGRAFSPIEQVRVFSVADRRLVWELDDVGSLEPRLARPAATPH